MTKTEETKAGTKTEEGQETAHEVQTTLDTEKKKDNHTRDHGLRNTMARTNGHHHQIKQTAGPKTDHTLKTERKEHTPKIHHENAGITQTTEDEEKIIPEKDTKSMTIKIIIGIIEITQETETEIIQGKVTAIGMETVTTIDPGIEGTTVIQGETDETTVIKEEINVMIKDPHLMTEMARTDQ